MLVHTCAAVCAVILLMAPAAEASSAKILHRFRPQEGAYPWGTLVFDNAGNLYGTTQFGGKLRCQPLGRPGCGVVFELSPQADGAWKQQVIYKFPGGANGFLPYAGVIFDGAGNLYGTTDDGGTGWGVVYELSPSAGRWTETVLHTFRAGPDDGAYPSPVVFDKSGNLYGTTYVGTTPCWGTVFQLSLNPQGGWAENVLHCFSNSPSDGQYPSAGVLFDEAGNLYSTTYEGGANGGGIAFELSPSSGTWTENILYNFSFGNEQVYPYAPLVADKNGNLYGLTYSGVYELTPTGSGWTYSTIYTSPHTPHAISPNSLIIDQDGNLYGTAGGGSSSKCRGGCGAVFKLAHGENGWQMTVLHNFPGGAGGSYPYGGLVMDKNGNLFGTTYYGGRKGCDCGLVFEITP